MNTEKLNEYLKLCDKVIETEKKDIVHVFDSDCMDSDLSDVSDDVILGYFKYHNIPCDELTDGPPDNWMSDIFGPDWEENYETFRDAPEHDELLSKYERMLEVIKAVVISGNIEAARDIKAYEDTLRSLRYI